MSRGQASITFRENAIAALRDDALRKSMENATSRFFNLRQEGMKELPFEEWRERASEIKLSVLDNLADYVDRFAAQATKVGAVVHRAKDAAAAREIVEYILKDRRAQKIVKAKSMITEEIRLNESLEEKGFTVVETDLGEYIVQLAKEHPSHILAPAIHKNRFQVGKLFQEKLGVEYSEDPFELTKIARKALRTEFLEAQAGISGVNFAIAETGSVVLFTNEGNGRMVTTMPPLHIAVMSMEKVIPTLADLAVFIRLLPRSATGQILSSYMSLITGTRKPGENTGAKEQHIVILDNGRSDIVKSEFREILKCIRCGACMNVCPVYSTIGGHAYDSTYPGPMGIILTTMLEGMERAHPLLDATTLCGACSEVCPVRVPLKDLIHRLREIRAVRGFTPSSERTAMSAFGVAAKAPALYSFGQSFMRLFWSAAKKAPGGGVLRRMPRPSDETFKRRM
jgi:L-lactate dehydrogenase complex protein LldF